MAQCVMPVVWLLLIAILPLRTPLQLVGKTRPDGRACSVSISVVNLAPLAKYLHDPRSFNAACIRRFQRPPNAGLQHLYSVGS